jgi:HAD superfamily hydrolase (TIGR01549 family)
MDISLTAIAFDLDMTLCHYELTVEEVIAKALSRGGFKADSFGSIDRLAADYNSAWWATEEALRVPLDELRRLAWVRMLAPRGVDETVANRVAQAYSAIRTETGVMLFDGVPELLAELRTDFPIGILTNGPSDMQWRKLHDLELPEAVDGIVVAGDRGFFKPDPRPFRELLSILGAEAQTTLFVGDSFEHDIVGAHGVGMRTAWIRSDGQDPSFEPDYVLEVATDVREVLR